MENLANKGGRPQEYGDRKLMTIRMSDNEMQRLKMAAQIETGGNLTKLVHDILMDYCNWKNY